VGCADRGQRHNIQEPRRHLGDKREDKREDKIEKKYLSSGAGLAAIFRDYLA
jgi:hypothetical protein